MAEEEKKEKAKEGKPEGKQRRPQAKKRDIQNEKRRLINRAYKAKTSSAIRALEEALASNQSPQERLNAVYSVMDKGVKSGIFKQNRASRVKARLTKKLLKAKA